MSAFAKYILEANEDRLPRAADIALAPRLAGVEAEMRAAERAGNAAGDDDLDDTTAAFRRKLGKWLKSTLAFLRDPGFWLAVRHVYEIDKPFNHMRLYLQKAAGSRAEDSSERLPVVVRFVVTDVRRIALPIASSMDPLHTQDHWDFILRLECRDLRARWFSISTRMACASWAIY